MTRRIFAAALLLIAGVAFAGESGYDVAAYVWPAYQPEPRWAELGIFAAGKGEWTEGSYLEPDTVNGFGYLEAVRRVFGAK